LTALGSARSAAGGSGEERRPRVLFICPALIVGGAEKQWSQLIPALRPKFDVFVLTLVLEGPFFSELRGRGIPVACAHMRNRFDLAGLRRAVRLVGYNPDLTVTQSINAHVVGHFIARRAGALHIANEHAGPGSPTRFHRDALNRLIAPRVDEAIAVSDAQLPRLLALGYRPDKIRVIRNGVPAPTPTESSSVVRARLNVQPDEFLALLVATLRPEKSAEVFVAAVRKAHRDDPRVRGVIVGGGSELDRIRDLAGDDRIVQVLGERLDVPGLVNACDVSCLSSSAEGVPMSLLEAMAVGKPVISTNVGGVPDAVEDGKTGLLVPGGDDAAFAEALVRLAADPALARRLGEAGRQRHHDLFSAERMVDEYVRAFQEVLATARASHRA
jgi:glycosyltransferase involved in cell wall biosynthesis